MYVDIFFNQSKNEFNVSERTNGKRILRTIPGEYWFYEKAPNGEYTSIFDDKCSKREFNEYNAFKDAKTTGLFESDVKPIFKILEKYYKDEPVEQLNISLIDIEADYDLEKGYAPADNPFNAITAISVKNLWENILYTVVLQPKNSDYSTMKAIADGFENTFFFTNEKDMLSKFLAIIEEADVLSGWNSELYDITYIVNRLEMLKISSRKMCLFEQKPKKSETISYGETKQTYTLIGRIHLDYLSLFKKYSYHAYPSYSLNSIGKEVVGETKVEYEGSLDDLYNKDFKKFIEYSRQDVELLAKMDKKLNYINFANLIAHQNCVPLETVLGTVQLTDNAILMEAHRRDMICPDKKEKTTNDNGIAGAFVAEPIPGLVEWVFTVDIASLYPSTFRSLNMSPETLIGQFRQPKLEKLFAEKEAELKKTTKREIGQAELWNGIFEIPDVTDIFNETEDEITLDFESGETITIKANQVYDMLGENNWILTANGTIFRTDKEGIIPSLLSRWYAERKAAQKKAKEFYKLYLDEQDEGKKDNYLQQYKTFDMQQMARKVNLNALYGAINNSSCKFNDQRMGQSCTLTGRTIDRHMGSKISELLGDGYRIWDDNKQHTLIVKAADTDSIMASIVPILPKLKEVGWELTRDNFVLLADSIADGVNDSFPDFMHDTYNVPKERSVISCNREICAETSLFVVKKKYAMLYFDKEGVRYDLTEKGNLKDNGGKIKSGRLKIMGLETQRSDTVPFVQQKLSDSLYLLLNSKDTDKTLEFIREWREEFKEFSPIQMGTPKSVNNISEYTEKFSNREQGLKTGMIPGNVMAALRWNKLLDENKDNVSPRIKNGTKVILVKLKGDITLAIPIDCKRPPSWFNELPFDKEALVKSGVDSKVENIFGCLGITSQRLTESNLNSEFFSW